MNSEGAAQALEHDPIVARWGMAQGLNRSCTSTPMVSFIHWSCTNARISASRWN